jgi:hypothetical protein
MHKGISSCCCHAICATPLMQVFKTQGCFRCTRDENPVSHHSNRKSPEGSSILAYPCTLAILALWP